MMEQFHGCLRGYGDDVETVIGDTSYDSRGPCAYYLDWCVEDNALLKASLCGVCCEEVDCTLVGVVRGDQYGLVPEYLEPLGVLEVPEA